MNTCPRYSLLSVVQKFYEPEYVSRARDILLGRADQRDNETVKIRHGERIKYWSNVNCSPRDPY